MSIQEKGLKIIKATKALIINTTGLDGYPNTRILYSQANDGYTVYFSSGAQTTKVREIVANSKVSAYYENTAQQLASWKNVVIYGVAELIVKESDEFAKAVELIATNSENFKKRVEQGQLDGNVLYKITPQRVKVLDFALEPRVEEFELGTDTSR